MPYIDKVERTHLMYHGPNTPGQLNYTLTGLIQEYLNRNGNPRYQDYNDVIGALECCKLELYRRRIAGYEDQKAKENGDVY